MSSEPTRMRAGDAAVELLARAGVRRLYTVPGESFLEVLDAAERHPGLTLVSTRHESGASFMAEADAKLTGTPAVAMATRGVGASNLAIGVHTARQDSTPMVVLLGQVETPFLGREAFQELDLPAFYAGITKWSATAGSSGRIPELVTRALRVATTGRPGPVMLAIPSDLLSEEIPPSTLAEGPPPPAPAPSHDELRYVMGRLQTAHRPVMVAGGGTRDARGPLISFSEAYGVGVYAAFRRQDHFPNDHPNYLGHLTLGTPPGTLEALEAADLVLVVGCRLSEITTQSYSLPRAEGAVIQVDIDPDVLGAALPIERGIVADASTALEALAARAPSPPPERDWSVAHKAYLDSSTIPREDRSSSGIDPARVIRGLQELLPEGAILANDAGNFSVFLHRYWRYNRPRTQLGPTSGAMGYGVPAAVAAKLASPEREVVALCGDGGFLMTGGEIETAVRYGVGITVVVFRNGMHGTIAMHQARGMGRTAGTEIGEVDLAAFARSLGAEGFTANSPDELEGALEGALSTEGPALVDVVTDPDLINPTARLSELAGGHS